MARVLKSNFRIRFLKCLMLALTMLPLEGHSNTLNQSLGVPLSDQALKIFCSGDATTAEFWKAGFYYAQVEGQWYEHPDAKRSLSLQEAHKELGFSLKQESGRSSFSKCDQRRFFRLSYPSKVRVFDSKDVLRITDSGECRGGVKAHYVAKSETLVKELVISGSVVNVSTLQDGYLSLSCFKSSADLIGTEFYLRPVGKAKFDFANGFDFEARKHTSISNWVSAIRQKVMLNEVKGHDSLRTSAGRLSVDQSVAHSAMGLEREYLSLKKNHLILLGENRAVGKSLREVALLFWVSPNHRKLLFDPRVVFMDESSSDRGGGHILLSLLAGKPS